MKFSFKYIVRRFALSPAESRVAIFVLCALGASIALRLWKIYLAPQPPEIPADFAAVDSVFAARTARANVIDSDTGSSAVSTADTAKRIFSFGNQLANSLHESHDKKLPSPHSINLNTASGEALMQLPSIGQAMAERIIAFRKSTPFKNVAELQRVKGFGKTRYARLEQYLTVE